MLLGKRPRPPIRRTTSMTGITVDFTAVEESEPSDAQTGPEEDESMAVPYQNPSPNERFLSSMVSPRNLQRNVSLGSSSEFLRTCGLCNRRLGHGRDIYMYRGDTPFCSLECREKQMKKDERKEKHGVVSSKKSFDRS